MNQPINTFETNIPTNNTINDKTTLSNIERYFLAKYYSLWKTDKKMFDFKYQEDSTFQKA